MSEVLCMNIGARTVKTGIAVALAIFVNNFFHLNTSAFSAIAAFIAIQPTVTRSWKHLWEQITANLVGGVIAILGFYFFGNSPLFVGIIIIFLVAINQKMGITNLTVAVICAIAIFEGNQDNFWMFAIERVVGIMLGVVCAILVNVLFFPPQYEKKLYAHIHTTHEHLSLLLRSVIHGELELKAYAHAKEEVNTNIKEAEELFDLYKEEFRYIRNKKKKYILSKKMVVFREMIEILRKEFVLLEAIEKEMSKINKLPNDLKKKIHKQLLYLTAYGEKIFMKYQEKVKIEKHQQLKERIKSRNSSFIDELFSLYKKDENNHEDNSFLYFLLPITTSIIQLTDESIRLDTLVENYRKSIKKD